MRFMVRYLSVLSILLALFFFTASVSAFYAFADTQASVQCCDKDEAPQFPVEEGECFDCQCLTCSATLNTLSEETLSVLSDRKSANWFLVEGHPTDYIQLIDYPPETC